MAAKRTIDTLLDLLAEDLVRRIKNGSATAADLNVARQLLKDNVIQAVATKDNGVGQLADSLPFQSPEQIADGEESFH